MAAAVTLIAGGTSGIGLAVAKRLLKGGQRVMICSRSQFNVDKALFELRRGSGDRVAGAVCHIGRETDRRLLVETTLKRFNNINNLVSTVGVHIHKESLLTCPQAAWDKLFEGNMTSTLALCREVLPVMKANGKGSILFTTSAEAYTCYHTTFGTYGVAKSALGGLTKHLSWELLRDNVRVNCVGPGAIIGTEWSYPLTGLREGIACVKNMSRMGRYGTAEEVAGLYAFLCSDDSSAINGEVLFVAGGCPHRK